MTGHCPTCTCELTDAELAEKARQERDRVTRKEREFAARHSVLTDADLDWARSQLPGNKPARAP